MTGEAALARRLSEQRWFGSKSRALAGGHMIDEAALSPDCALALFEVEFAEGESELYQLPYRREEGGGTQLSLADPPLARALLAALRRAEPLATRLGQVELELAAALPQESALEPVRPVGGEQSNSSIVFGESALLKAYRRLEPGESTELEMLRFLAAHGFEHMPRLLGWYGYAGPRITATLGLLQAYVRDARDGWKFALATFAEPAPFLARLQRLGEITARMHAVLASAADDPAFAPEPLAAEGLARLGEAAGAEARALLGGLERGGPSEPVRARGDELLERLRALYRLESGGQAIRQHGDYHLGQVLWSGGDWLVLDFEGEPARPAAARRRKSSPLRDVAGMLRSFAYAAETSRSRGDVGASDWERAARAAFLTGYDAVADPALLPPSAAGRTQLLAACELEKALYELRYELDNRPAWVHVAVTGILRLLDET